MRSELERLASSYGKPKIRISVNGCRRCHLDDGPNGYSFTARSLSNGSGLFESGGTVELSRSFAEICQRAKVYTDATHGERMAYRRTLELWRAKHRG